MSGMWVMAIGSLLAAATPGPVLPDNVRTPARPFPLQQVRVIDPDLCRMQSQTRAYLHELASDRLLRNFRVNAGIPTDVPPLPDHESPSSAFRGHYTGHFLSACAMMYAGTGDEPLKRKADAIVAELAKCQQPSGYLAGWPESMFDDLEAGKRVGVVWYGLHKIMAGLLDMYVYAGNQQALEIVKKIGDWAAARTARLSHAKMQQVLQTEFGGMGEVLANLAAATGDEKYLRAARRFDHDLVFEPAAAGQDTLSGLHANTQIPKFVAAAREYELTGNEFYRKAATFFWRQVALHRSYAGGGNSVREQFRTPPDVLAGTLESNSQESCNTYNMLRLTEHLFAWEPLAVYADFYERAFLNHILAIPHPKAGMPLYYLGLLPGQWKIVFVPHQSFWCCAGTGLEDFAKLQRGIYYEGDEQLWVNLFFASELDWKAKGVTIRQQTAFPNEPGTTIVIRARQPAAFKLHLRIPYWADRAGIAVNGQPVAGDFKPSSYATVERTWKDGDVVRLDLPMRLHLHPLPDDRNVAAIMYGPVLLAGELGSEGITESLCYGPNYNNSETFQKHPCPDADKLALVGTTEKLEDWIEPFPGKPLTFRTKGVGRPRDFILSPFYRLFDQRYNIYWKLEPGKGFRLHPCGSV